MRDSSVKTTSFHSAAHILLSSHHWQRRRKWFCVKGRISNGRLADRPLCYKRLRMVRADTVWCVTDSMCCATYPKLIFQQDNAKPHTTHVAMNCLTANQKLPSPARSLSNRACLGYDGKATTSIREC
ncbi:hypothetical protein TNCV_3297881 [Trichonephila clavipes]|uniref:Transposase n=1 Tax=Trichonephila clavipes TaxID=2585209 RepID=A0A8X6VTG9_TRICX|nr:hypothetical protein TNCV_3297881 [Trichonephila clavipes]